MGYEIERKFLVKGDEWRTAAEGSLCRQGYISAMAGRIVRVRTLAGRGFLTVKGMCHGIARPEFEYAIPLADADAMLDEICAKPLIEKKRYRVPFAGLVFEVDEFFGENAGLIVAEVELLDEKQKIDLPGWIGVEVSNDPRYCNSNLVSHPFCRWQQAAKK